jgi:hypothetical protein
MIEFLTIQSITPKKNGVHDDNTTWTLSECETDKGKRNTFMTDLKIGEQGNFIVEMKEQTSTKGKVFKNYTIKGRAAESDVRVEAPKPSSGVEAILEAMRKLYAKVDGVEKKIDAVIKLQNELGMLESLAVEDAKVVKEELPSLDDKFPPDSIGIQPTKRKTEDSRAK